MACNRASGRCIGLDEAAVSSTACAASVDIPTGMPCFSDRWCRIRLGARHSAGQPRVEPSDSPRAYLAQRIFIHSGRFATQGFPAQRNLPPPRASTSRCATATAFCFVYPHARRSMPPSAWRSCPTAPCRCTAGQGSAPHPVSTAAHHYDSRSKKKTPPFPGAFSSRVMTWCCSITARSQSSSSEHSWPGQGSWP